MFVWIVFFRVLQQLLTLLCSNHEIPGPHLRDQDAYGVALPLTAPKTFCLCGLCSVVCYSNSFHCCVQTSKFQVHNSVTKMPMIWPCPWQPLQPQELSVCVDLCSVLQPMLSLMCWNVQIPGPQLRDQDACDVALPWTALLHVVDWTQRINQLTN